MKEVMEIAEFLSKPYVSIIILAIVILLVFWRVKYGFSDPPSY